MPFITSFATVIGALVEKASASVTLVFSFGNAFAKKIKSKEKIIIFLARSKRNSTENITSETLADTETSHEEFQLISNEAEKYRKLKESLRIMESQRNDI